MRVESAVTAITWLPFAALDALPDLPLGVAVAHYDEPPPDVIRDLEGLREADAFREANELRAWAEFEGHEVVEYGFHGRALSGEPGLELGAEQVAFPAVEFPAIRPDPDIAEGCARFAQTVGGRIGIPVPRPVRGKPYFHIGSALAWTTLELVLRANGEGRGRLVAASPFPAHSLYDAEGRLVETRGMLDFDGWYRESFGDTPWGNEAASAVEAQLEEELTRVALESGAKLGRRRVRRGDVLVREGEAGGDMFMLLDGVLDVEVGGDTVAQVGPGAVLGELAALGDGKRQATLRAGRACRVAVLPADQISSSKLAKLALAWRSGSDWSPTTSG